MDTSQIFVDMARQAREFAEMCDRVANESNAVKEDPEAWRERNRQRQAAGVKFEWCTEGIWRRGYKGSLFTFDVGGEEDYREVQEAPKVKENDVIPEASREILKAWQANGLKFKVIGMTARFALEFTDKTASSYSIPEQRIPEGMSVETVEGMWRQGLRVIESCDYTQEVNHHFNWFDGTYKGAELLERLRIPAQPIPERLLEVPQDVSASECQKALEHLARTYSADKGTAQLNPTIPPHAAERALWKAQREAGTNEVWQWKYFDGAWIDIDLEPRWTEKEEYRVKPTKLTARICMVGKAYPMSYIGQDWQFTGTREEYHAECEKYGYAVVGEIKEVDKPKTVKHYFCMFKDCNGRIDAFAASSAERLQDLVKRVGCTIIGNIEEREVPIMDVINLKGIV